MVADGPLVLLAPAESDWLGADRFSLRCAEGEEKSGIDTSFTVALVSDYRISGVSQTGKAAALQASVDVETESGWYVGLWGSNIKEFEGSHVEVDLYGGKTFDMGETEASLGLAAIFLPGGSNIAVGLADGSVSHPIGPVDASLSFRYAWAQNELGDEDDLYVALEASSPIGKLGGVPLTLGGSLGYEEGVFVPGAERKWDWSLSLTAEVGDFEIAASYVDTDIEDENGDAACLFSIVRTF